MYHTLGLVSVENLLDVPLLKFGAFFESCALLILHVVDGLFAFLGDIQGSDVAHYDAHVQATRHNYVGLSSH